MPYTVRCKACSTSFAIPDEIWDKRVKGRVATLKCRSCKCDIQVDGTKAGVPMASQAPPARASRPPSEVPSAPSAASQPEASQPLAAKLASPTTASAQVAAPSAAATIKSPTPTTAAIGTGPSATTGTAWPAAKAALPVTPAVGSAAATILHLTGKAATDIVAPETGWSLMPPPGELEQVGISPNPAPAAALTSPATPAAPVAEPTALKAYTPAPAATEPDIAEDLPPDPDLWVVSYGDDDDRELTEKQIAAELAKGSITLSTIVWQDGMPEWLPISGVKVLAKYAPQSKPAPVRQAKLSPGGKATAPAAAARTATSSATSTTAGAKPTSVAQRQPLATREKQPSSTQLEPKAARRREGDPELPAVLRSGSTTQTTRAQQPVAAEPKSPKGPPPLTRGTEKQPDQNVEAKPDAKPQPPPLASGSRVPEPKTGGKPPALTRRAQVKTDAKTPWDASDDIANAAREDSSDQVFTSAPDLSAALQASIEAKAQKAATAAVATAVARATVSSSEPANIAKAADSNAQSTPIAPAASVPRSTPSQRPSAKSSLRPPKPAETATSLVLRTEPGTPHDLLITDDDFLAMQRRYPKWALPAGIAGGVAAIGLFIWAVNSAEAPTPHSNTPTTTTDTLPRENLAHQPQPRHQQPDLSAIPTAAPNTGEEKDFAKLFAQSASKTNSTFDSKAAERAALNVMELASRCRVAPDPAGQARVVVTFATAGQVLSIQVGSPYANTATGRCVDKALRTIKTHPFQGEPGRLPLTVPIH